MSFFPSPLVGEGGAQRRMRGLYPQRKIPSPVRDAAHRGHPKSELRSSRLPQGERGRGHRLLRDESVDPSRASEARHFRVCRTSNPPHPGWCEIFQRRRAELEHRRARFAVQNLEYACQQRAGGQELQQAATVDGMHMMRRHGCLPKRVDFVVPQSVDTRRVRSMKRVQSGRALI
jgi:hypothetical protein